MNIFTKAKGLLAAAAVCLSCAACGGGTDELPPCPAEPSVSADDASWAVWDTGAVVLENDRVRLEMDTQTAHFTVTDKRTGARYRSVPEGATATGEDEGRIVSELTVRYYAQQTEALYMYAGVDSVPGGRFQIKSDGRAIRVTYTMGAADIFVPTVFSQVEFETRILDKLGSAGLQRRLTRYYILYDPADQDPPADYSDKLAQYPPLESTPLYILDDAVSDMEKEEISGYMTDAGYTPELYAAERSRHGLPDVETEKPAGFVVPVEYRLCEDGFTASVLADRIVESSEEYKLQAVDLLEYFASFGAQESGTYLIPDGSGALLRMDGQTTEQVAQPFYGEDVAVQTDSRTQLAKTLALPVFGMQTGQGGVLAVVERGAEVATLNARPLGASSSHNRLYASFEMRHLDVTDLGADMQIPVFNLFAKERVDQSPQIRYMLLEPQRSDYAAMAARYREYLHADGSLPAPEQAPEAGLYLDYLCMTTEQSSLLGVPYTKKTVLSTLPDILASVEKLHAAGVRGLIVRLVGYGSGGMEHGAYKSFSLDGRVGTREELLALADALAAKGGRLYLDADVTFAYTNKNGFRPTEDAAHYLNRTLVRTDRYDIVSRQYHGALSRFLVSPMRYGEYARSFLDSMEPWRGDTPLGLAYSAAGLYLGGDHTPKRGIDRTKSAAYLREALQSSHEAAGGLLFDNGNGYVLPYAGHLLGVPHASSQTDMESASVPFYQMVVHGSVPYAGTPVNIAADSEETRLRATAYGAVPYAVCITEEDDVLSGTAYQSMLYSLSVGSGSRLNSLLEWWRSADGCRQAVAGAYMIGYTPVTPSVTRTDYSNGARVYVNTGGEAATVEGVRVEARGFALAGVG